MGQIKDFLRLVSIFWLTYFSVVADEDVGLGFVLLQEVAVDDRLGNDGVEVCFVICQHGVSQQTLKQNAVLVIHQAVLKHSTTLMVPQPKQISFRLRRKRER